MDISKLTATQNTEPKMDRVKVAKMRRQNFKALTAAQLNECTCRRDVAVLCGVLDSTKGDQFVHNLIRTGKLKEDIRPEGKYYWKPGGRRPVTRIKLVDEKPKEQIDKPKTVESPKADPATINMQVSKNETTFTFNNLTVDDVIKLLKEM